MKEGKLTDFGGPYGYRGKLMDDGSFHPHKRLADGTLQPIEPTEPDPYINDSGGYFIHDWDSGRIECYREQIGGPLLFRSSQ